MGKALMIGAGGVAGVVAHKCCQNWKVFGELCIASRTLSKCEALKAKLEGCLLYTSSDNQVHAPIPAQPTAFPPTLIFLT